MWFVTELCGVMTTMKAKSASSTLHLCIGKCFLLQIKKKKKCNVQKVTGNPKLLYQHVCLLGIKSMNMVLLTVQWALPTPYFVVSIAFYKKKTASQCVFLIKMIGDYCTVLYILQENTISVFLPQNVTFISMWCMPFVITWEMYSQFLSENCFHVIFFSVYEFLKIWNWFYV